MVSQEVAKKRAKVDKAGPSRPPSEAHPSAQADSEDPEAGAKVPERFGAKAPEGPKAPVPPPPEV